MGAEQYLHLKFYLLGPQQSTGLEVTEVMDLPTWWFQSDFARFGNNKDGENFPSSCPV